MGSSTDPSLIRILGTATTINRHNVTSGIVMRETKLLSNPNLWHKIAVQCTERYNRDLVLKTIMDDVHPFDFIPVYFSSDGAEDYFFVRNCRQAIEKLCRQNLIIGNPINIDFPFKLTIILAYSNTTELVINVQDNISTVLNKRYQASTKMMNLDNFYKDPDLKEFCALSQPKILYFVLHLSKTYAIKSLKLSNNDIHILTPVESILGMKSLVTLDLRNNMISKMSELNILKSMHIKELFLDGNPLCDDFDEFSYIQALRGVCPNLEKLDGCVLGQKGFLPLRRNYLCKSEGQELVDQFLEHYFTLFDEYGRYSLFEAYSADDSLFSLTCHYLTGQTSSSQARLMHYKGKSRNLKVLSDLSKNSTNLKIGKNAIAQFLQTLPHTEHDPYSFTVDLVFHSDKLSIFVITGVFREVSTSLLDTERILGFTRTFVLRALANNEYSIINDQWHISNATTTQQQRAFKVVRVPRTRNVKLEAAKNENERNEMEEAFQQITTVNMEWSKKCLQECKYDLVKALNVFVDLHKVDRVPEEAFA